MNIGEAGFDRLQLAIDLPTAAFVGLRVLDVRRGFTLGDSSGNLRSLCLVRHGYICNQYGGFES